MSIAEILESRDQVADQIDTLFLEVLQESGRAMPDLPGNLRREDGGLDTQNILEFSELFNIRETLRTYVPFMMLRAHETDTEAEAGLSDTKRELRDAVFLLKEHGYTFEEAVKFFEDIRISKSPTQHPTEGLCPEAIAQCEALMRAAERPKEERDEAIKKVMHDMLALDHFGAIKKDNVLDEIDNSNRRARIHNEGCNDLERYTEKCLYDAYGRRAKIRLDTAMRSWDPDSDGKNNAEGWAMIAKLSTTTLAAIEDTIVALKKAEDHGHNSSVSKLKTQLETVVDRLRPIHDRSREVVKDLAAFSPEHRHRVYESLYPEYQEMEEAFAHIYDQLREDENLDKSRGVVVYHYAVNVLDDLRNKLLEQNSPVFSEIDAVYRILRRTGIALEKMQPRQNDLIHAEIIDNLFKHADFRALNILSAKEFSMMDAAGGLKELYVDQQHKIHEKILAYAKSPENRQQILDMLYRANPLGFESNGYPKQTRSLLDRFKLRSTFPLKFDQGIISDAGWGAVVRQHFLASLFGMPNMHHMPLNEDRKTLPFQHQLMEKAHDLVGKKVRAVQRARALSDERLEKYFTSRDIHAISVMRPRSDSTRGGGIGTGMEGLESYRQITYKSFECAERETEKKKQEEAVPSEIMNGGGAALGRGGDDAGITRRIVEQTSKTKIKALAEKRGKPFSHRNTHDRRMMAMAQAILYTEQGRSKRLYTATPGQVTDSFAGYIIEMIHGRLDLEGLVPDYTYIAKSFEFSNPDMKEIADNAWNGMIEKYSAMRFVRSHDNGTVLDKLADKVTCPHVISYMNNGARPGAKNLGSKKMTQVRAIENDQRNYISQLFTADFGSGKTMQDFHQKIADGAMSENDLLELLNHPEWDFIIWTRALADAARKDYTYALNQIGWSNASFDDLVAIGQSVKFHKYEGRDHHEMTWNTRDGTITEEQAYISKLFYDRLLLVSLTEASLNGTMNQPLEKIIEAVRPDDNSIYFGLGEKTKAKFPVAVEIAEEHKRIYPMMAIMYTLEAALVDSNDPDALIKELGGEAFFRQVAAGYRAATLPHWQYLTGAKNCALHNVVEPRPQPVPEPGLDAQQCNIA